MRNLIDILNEAKVKHSKGYDDFIKFIKGGDFRRKEIRSIISYIPEWAETSDTIFANVYSDEWTDKIQNYVYDDSNWDNSEVISEASYGEYELTVCWNDNVFYVNGCDAACVLYKSDFKFK